MGSTVWASDASGAFSITSSAAFVVVLKGLPATVVLVLCAIVTIWDKYFSSNEMFVNRIYKPCNSSCRSFPFNEILPMLMYFLDYMPSKVFWFCLSIKCKLILWFTIWYFINLEPFNGSFHQTRILLLNIRHI